MSVKIAVTGANGFVGRAVSRVLLAQGFDVVGVVRREAVCESGVIRKTVDSLDTLRPEVFDGCAAVIHLAARVHVMRDAAVESLSVFRAVNVEGALRVAQAAVSAGARRFVYMSSIKALADRDNGRPLNEIDVRHPTDFYGVSKAEGEVALQGFGARTGMDVIIVRPPLVYGPEVRANFLSLVKAIAKGLPLPIGAVNARRSLCFINNLASATVLCAIHPSATGGLFHVTDGDDPAVADLARSIGRHLGKPARLIPVPIGMLRFAGRVTGRLPQVERLTDSLQVDSTHIRTALNWSAPVSLDDGLAMTAAWFAKADGGETFQ